MQLHASASYFTVPTGGFLSSESCAQRLRLVISIARMPAEDRFVAENTAKTERKD